MIVKYISILKVLLALAIFCSLLVAAATIRSGNAEGGSETTGGWQFLGPPGGDKDVRLVTVDPEDENLWYVGTVDNGLYITRDGGTTWEQHISGNVRTIVVDPNNPNTVYASSGADLYVSDNQGRDNTWECVFSHTEDPINPGTFIESMLVSRIDGSIFLGFGGTQNANATILKSKSSDPKAGWDISFVAPQVGFHFWHLWDIAEDPINGYLYFCTEVQDTYAQPNPTMRSTNRGQSWEDISPLEGIGNPHGLGIEVHPITRAVYYLSETRWLFTSFDFGRSWQLNHVPINAQLIIDKDHPNRLYGAQIPSEGNLGGVYFSDDIGKSFICIGLENRPIKIALDGTGTRLVAGVNGEGIYVMNVGIGFPDPVLKFVVMEAIGKDSGDIQPSDLAGLTELDANNAYISDLSGLEWCTNLKSLSLAGNQISDISPLQGLTNLISLELRSNQISDISPLSGLANLTELCLDRNPISDISALQGLTSLQYLSLIHNQIGDISPLSGLGNLTDLIISYNQISDITPLQHLTKLRQLHLAANNISDITPLSNLTNLTSLGLDDNQISDITPLSALPNLNSLVLRGNRITDIQPLAANTWVCGLLDLRHNPLSAASLGIYIPQLKLKMSETRVDYDDPVVTFPDPNLDRLVRQAIRKPTGDIYQSELAGLTELWARASDITDLSGLEYCTSLTHLELQNNRIGNITPLRGLTGLAYLYLMNNQINDISPLSNLTDLTVLNLEGNQIGNITPLHDLTSLTVLNLYGNQVGDIGPLAGLTSLTELCLAANQVSAIGPLSGLTNLTTLWLWSNQIKTISPLSNLTNLTTLWISSNQISDIRPLSGLTNLTSLALGDNQISDIKPLVDNLGIGSGDTVDLTINPLDGSSLGIYIRTLEGRGVTLLYDSNLEAVFPDPNLEQAVRDRLNIPDPQKLFKADLRGLNQLVATRRGIADLSGLEYCTTLSELNLSYNQISDVSPLQNLSNLKMLQVQQNRIGNVSTLEYLTKLSYLDLSWNQISDISALERLTNLSNLLVYHNLITDISALVRNSGITGQNDLVELRRNLLDLWEGSQDLADIRALEARQVTVYYDPITQPLIAQTQCPVDLQVVDPDGLVIDKGSNAIELASYIEKDLDGDGDLDDMVVIRSPKLGDYRITVIPEQGAPSSETFSLWVTANDTTITLAHDVKLGDIPAEPYTVELTAEGAVKAAPVAEANGSYSGTEGSPITFDASGSYDPDGTVALYEWDFGDGSTGTGASPTHACGDNGKYTVTLTVTDDDRLSSVDTTEVTVSNVAPNVEAGTDQKVEVFNSVSCKGKSSDPGWLDTHTAKWDWGDGTTSDGTVTEVDGSGNVTGSHTYSLVGNYTVTLTVTDDDGGVGTDTLNMEVIQKYAIWGNSTDAKAVLWSGSGAKIKGNVNSNGGVTMSGSNNAVDGIVYYVSKLTISGSKDTFTSPQIISPRPMPVHYDLSNYQTGGQVINGNFNVSKSGTVLDGLYYVKGNVALSASNIKGTFTIVAEGTISISGSGMNCTPYSSGLLFFSNGASFGISGSNSSLGGIIYVPKGQIAVSGSGNKINGSLFGDKITLSGSNMIINVK